jgi:hypothetical protein
MKSRFHVPFVLSTLVLCGTSVAQSVVENAGISATQRDFLEQRTCGAWHGRRIAAFRTRELPGRNWLTVSLECEPHDQFRDLPLSSAAVCEGWEAEWKCESVGLELDLGTADDPRPVRMLDITPEKALELHAFIAEQARTGRRIRTPILGGHLTLFTSDNGASYVATFEFSDHATALDISARCGKRGCRYRLENVQSYSTWNDL